MKLSLSFAILAAAGSHSYANTDGVENKEAFRSSMVRNRQITPAIRSITSSIATARF